MVGEARARHAGREHHAHDAEQPEQVEAALELERAGVLGRGGCDGGRVFLPLAHEGDLIEDREQRQQHAVDQRPGRREPQCPGERDAPQEAQEQGRIAKRGEQAARVRDDEDEEHHDVRGAPPVGVGAQQRPDQQRGRAGGADQAGEQRADAENSRVHDRRAHQRPAQADPARDREQRPQQGHEREVVAAGAQQQRRAAFGMAAEQEEDRRRAGHQRQDQLVDVALPEPPREQRQRRDQEQIAHERSHRPGRRQVGRCRGQLFHRG